MKIYLASHYARHPEMRGYRDELHPMGHLVTSRWIDCHPELDGDLSEAFTPEYLNTYPEKCAVTAMHDIEDLMAADVVIVFPSLGGQGGHNFEFGWSGAKEKRLMLVGQRMNPFHCLSAVEQFDTWEAARAAL